MPVAGLANGLPWACSGARAGFPRETRDLLAGGARQPQCLKPRACFGAQQLAVLPEGVKSRDVV